MTVKYQDNQLRVGSEKPRFMMPGDTARAREMGFSLKAPGENKAYDIIDDSVEKLINLIGRKGWDLPGIEVTFDAYGTRNQPLHRILGIKGDLNGQKWSLEIGRSPYLFDHYNICTQASGIAVPGHKISIHDDNSGSYVRYVGKDWEADQEEFFSSYNYHSKMNNKPRTYLRYDRRGPVFSHTNDCGRDYDLEAGEPKTLGEQEIFAEVGNFLDQVAVDLERYPDAKESPYESWERLMAVEEKPVPANVPSLFVTKRDRDADNQDGVVLYGSGWRLCPLDYARYENHPVPDIATEGFEYAYPSKLTKSGFWGGDPASLDAQMYKIDLKRSNDIYVVDQAPFMACREDLMKKLDQENRDTYTDEEMAAQYSAMAQTITPLEQYQNNFEKPLYLINRPLRADEAVEVTEQCEQWLDEASAITRRRNIKKEKRSASWDKIVSRVFGS